MQTYWQWAYHDGLSGTPPAAMLWPLGQLDLTSATSSALGKQSCDFVSSQHGGNLVHGCHVCGIACILCPKHHMRHPKFWLLLLYIGGMGGDAAGKSESSRRSEKSDVWKIVRRLYLTFLLSEYIFWDVQTKICLPVTDTMLVSVSTSISYFQFCFSRSVTNQILYLLHLSDNLLYWGSTVS